mmetsp:Transcript_136875/g.437901  ORF Transcript_136875/g.437901 Transcript_136875/m.437901 type:complete len:716 (+) Transcript_136875:67-2214(+)
MVRLGAVAGTAVLFAAIATVGAQPGQQPQKIAVPNWLDDEGKDIFKDLEDDENIYGDNSCELREKLLKKMAGKGEKDASDHRARVLLGLGLCTFRRGDYTMSKKRLESAISEMNFPSEDWMLQNQQVAHLALIKQAAVFMSRHEITQASTALRRCREILDRNLKKILKQVHKQMGAQGQSPPLENIVEELAGYGKTGQFLPMIMKQVPVLSQDLSFSELVDQALDNLDRRIAGIDPSLKAKKLRLDTSKGKGTSKGSLMYVRSLPTEAVVSAGRSAAVQEFISNGGIDALKEEVAALEKGMTLIKRTKEGSGCKEGKGLEKTCKALNAVADIAANGFGETRVVMVKAGKPQVLDVCETNANIAILIAAKDGATAKIKGVAEPVTLGAGEPVVIDFCREVTLEASSGVPVLFAQAWHPEFAALERSTELRARSKNFELSEDDVKAATKVVNDYAKKNWEKAAALWRKDSEGHASIKASFENEISEKKKVADDAAEAKRLEEDAGDEEKQKKLEELELKRAEKRKKAEAAEQLRLKRKQQLEEERAQRDPWLNFPSVLAAETHLAELKEARRDANAKLEFDLSTQLTKDISAADRALKKATKTARKLHKKGGTAADDAAAKGKTADSEAEDKEEKVDEQKEDKKKEKKVEKKEKKEEGAKAKAKPKGESSELKELKSTLEALKKKKQEAADTENFKEAKKLKKEQDELEKKIKKLEL